MKRVMILGIVCLILVIGMRLTPMTLRRILPIRKVGTNRLKKRAAHVLTTRKPFIPFYTQSRSPFPLSSSPYQSQFGPFTPNRPAHTSFPQNELLIQLRRAVNNQDIDHLHTLADQEIYVTRDQLRDIHFNPLATAVRFENRALVNQLLAMGFDPNFTLPSEDSTLALAIEAGNYAIANMLIKAGANVNSHVQESGASFDSGLERQVHDPDQRTLRTQAAMLYNYLKNLLTGWH